MTAARVEDETSAMVADALQAAYFRGCLAHEREQAAEHLGKYRLELEHRFETGALSGTSHLQSQVRSLDAELRYIDRPHRQAGPQVPTRGEMMPRRSTTARLAL